MNRTKFISLLFLSSVPHFAIAMQPEATEEFPKNRPLTGTAHDLEFDENSPVTVDAYNNTLATDPFLKEYSKDIKSLINDREQYNKKIDGIKSRKLDTDIEIKFWKIIPGPSSADPYASSLSTREILEHHDLERSECDNIINMAKEYFISHPEKSFFESRIKQYLMAVASNPNDYKKEIEELKAKINLIKNEMQEANKPKSINSEGGIVKTLNKCGDIVLSNNFIKSEYQKYTSSLLLEETTSPHRVLDIGTATGENSLAFLQQGGTVVGNDLELGHLMQFRMKANKRERERLWFNTDRFPKDLDQHPKEYSAILLSHVAHYLTGNELQEGFSKIRSWLRKDGKFFFQALTPFANCFSWRARKAEVLLKDGHQWPGFYRNRTEELYKALCFTPGEKFLTIEEDDEFPELNHPIQPEILERELSIAGLKIEYLNYSKFPDENPQRSPISYKEHKFYVTGGSSEDDEQERLKIENKIKLTEKDDILLNNLIEDRFKYMIHRRTDDELIKLQGNIRKPYLCPYEQEVNKCKEIVLALGNVINIHSYIESLNILAKKKPSLKQFMKNLSETIKISGFIGDPYLDYKKFIFQNKTHLCIKIINDLKIEFSKLNLENEKNELILNDFLLKFKDKIFINKPSLSHPDLMRMLSYRLYPESGVVKSALNPLTIYESYFKQYESSTMGTVVAICSPNHPD